MMQNNKIIAKPNSAVALQPCPSGHITAELPSATSFIRKMLGEIASAGLSENLYL